MLGSPLINTDKAAITGIKNYEIRSQKQSFIFYLDLQKFMEDHAKLAHEPIITPINGEKSGTISENHFLTLISFPLMNV